MSDGLNPYEWTPYVTAAGVEVGDILVNPDGTRMACAKCDDGGFVVDAPITAEGRKAITVVNGHLTGHKRREAKEHNRRVQQEAREARKGAREAEKFLLGDDPDAVVDASLEALKALQDAVRRHLMAETAFRDAEFEREEAWQGLSRLLGDED